MLCGVILFRGQLESIPCEKRSCSFFAVFFSFLPSRYRTDVCVCVILLLLCRILVTLMLANNETGALQPIAEVSRYCRQHGILFATDAAQAVGKVSVTLTDLGDPDMVTIVGHKFGAPKGIACLYVRPGCFSNSGDSDTASSTPALTGLLVGGGQECGRRAGTENVPYIVGMGVAAELCSRHLQQNQAHLERMRSLLLSRLQDELGADQVVVHGPSETEHRLPNTLSVAFAGGIQSSQLLHAVRNRVAASAGAACHSTSGPVSTILQAMQIPDSLARATVRLSVGPDTTANQVRLAAQILVQEVLRQENNRPCIPCR
jgi:cysteine desulfurase